MEPVFKRTNLPLANCAFVVHLPHRENNKKYASEGLIVRVHPLPSSFSVMRPPSPSPSPSNSLADITLSVQPRIAAFRKT